MSTEASSAAVNIPQVIITEPSPQVQTQSVTVDPTPEVVAPAQEGQAGGIPMLPEQTNTKDSVLEQTTSAPEQERESSSEFSPAEDCSECIVSVPEVAVSEPAEPTTASSESDPDEFRTYRCCNFSVDFTRTYMYLWNILESRYAIPFWLLMLSLPLSAGIMGAIYMFKCPAADSLPNMVFMIGVSLMAIITLRVCIILHRITWLDENARSMLQTMNLICLFITSFFFITESVSYWQITSSTHPGADDYCHPTFSTYMFWWNIATSVFMVIILMFPIA